MQYLCAGIIAATVRNLFISEEDTPVNAWDYVPGGKHELDQAQSNEDWSEAALARAQMWATQHNLAIKMKEEMT